MQAEIAELAALRDMVEGPAYDDKRGDPLMDFGCGFTERLWWVLRLYHGTHVEDAPIPEEGFGYYPAFAHHNLSAADGLFEKVRGRFGAASYTVIRDHGDVGKPPFKVRFPVANGLASGHGPGGRGTYEGHGYTPSRALVSAIIAAEIGYRRGVEATRQLQGTRA